MVHQIRNPDGAFGEQTVPRTREVEGSNSTGRVGVENSTFFVYVTQNFPKNSNLEVSRNA